MSVVISHPTGNANVRAVLRTLQNAGLLRRFHTSVAVPDARWIHVLGPAMDRRLGQRRFAEVPWSRVRRHPTRELVRQAARRFGPAVLVCHESGWASVDAVYAAIDRAVAAGLRRDTSSPRAVYAYEDGALETFRTAQKIGVTRIYDLPIAHWRTLHRLLTEEADRLPEWAPTMEGLRDSAAKHDRKDEEIRLADHVLVASSFTRSSLVEHFGPDLRVTTIPYGCPRPLVSNPDRREHGAPLHLMFAGHLTQRKGVADLIAALDRVAIDWRLTLAGPRPATIPPALGCLLKDPRCRWLGVVPHRTLLEEMSKAHVFVFPSIVEGFGMVLTEAMAAGLPVITTPNTAGPDILTEGRDGFIVPIRDPDALADRITLIAEDEPLRAQMAAAALDTAGRRGWAAYEDGVIRVLRDMLGP